MIHRYHDHASSLVLLHRPGLNILVKNARGTVSVRVDEETCLWQAVMLARVGGPGTMLVLGETGAMWTYGFEEEHEHAGDHERRAALA